MSKKLTPGMRKALLQIGFGVSGRIGGFYDEGNERVDLRSAQALLERGLIFSLMQGSNPLRPGLRLTPKGDDLFEEIRLERR